MINFALGFILGAMLKRLIQKLLYLEEWAMSLEDAKNSRLSTAIDRSQNSQSQKIETPQKNRIETVELNPKTISDKKSGSKSKAPWTVYPFSRTGFSHLNRSVENQDAIKYQHFNGGLSIAVADGHGSSKSPLSSIGSSLAVETFMEVSEAMFFSGDGVLDPKRAVAMVETLSKSILRTWKNKVDSRWNLIKSNEDFEGAQFSYKLFGTTLIGLILVSEEYAVCFKLGDGNVSMLLQNDECVKLFAEKEDAGLVGTETYSMSSDNAVHLSDTILVDNLPNAFFLYTDGIDDSVENDEDLVTVLMDCFSIRKNPDDMSNYLDMVSRGGAADDTSLAITCID